MAALILVLRSRSTTRALEEASPEIAEPPPADVLVSQETNLPNELLLAWVQFLKDDITKSVNTLHNRFNVISHTLADANSDRLDAETKQALNRIKNECDRASKITSGLLHRIKPIAPDTAPPILFEYDGATLPSSSILLIEDDDANRTVISKVFRRLGQSVTPVASGFEAYEVMQTTEPDCIISDVRLPYLDGRTFFEQVERENPYLASRFVFVTGDFSNPETMTFLKATGQPYVTKPYEMESLLGAVAVILRRGIQDDSEVSG